MHFLPLALGFAASVSAMGINCKGSQWCDGFKSPSLNTTRDVMKEAIKSGDQIPSRVYHNHENIACYIGRYCVFYQKGASGTLGEALEYVEELLNEGCEVCGSVPIVSDDVNDGELTVNYVWNREFKCLKSDGATMCSDADIRFMLGQHDTPEDHVYDNDSNDGP